MLPCKSRHELLQGDTIGASSNVVGIVGSWSLGATVAQSRHVVRGGRATIGGEVAACATARAGPPVLRAMTTDIMEAATSCYKGDDTSVWKGSNIGTASDNAIDVLRTDQLPL